MTSVERVFIPQYAVLWTPTGKDDYGNTVVSAPQEIEIEWPQGFTESQGNQDSKESSSDEVVVNESLPLGALFWPGRLSDLPASPSPLYVSVGRRVQPDIKNRNTRYTLTLALYSNTLPTVQ